MRNEKKITFNFNLYRHTVHSTPWKRISFWQLYLIRCTMPVDHTCNTIMLSMPSLSAFHYQFNQLFELINLQFTKMKQHRKMIQSILFTFEGSIYDRKKTA